MSAAEVLAGTAFALTGEANGASGSFAVWGRGTHSSFDGRNAGLSLDGKVTTGMLGADYARDRSLVGLALSQSRGEGSYSGSGSGRVESSLTAAIPYAAVQASSRLKLWGVAGHGSGEVKLTPTDQSTMTADMNWTMAAAGARSDLVPSKSEGPALAVVSDAMWVRTESEKTAGLAAASADVTRLRLGLEGSFAVVLDGGRSLTPRLETGLRHDGGDAETGFGVELGGGLAWVDPRLGLSLDVEGRGLLAHEADGLRDRGYSASLVFDPTLETQRGLSLHLRYEIGGPAVGGLDALFAAAPLESRTGAEATGRWTTEAAWGFPVFRNRFTASPHTGVGLSEGARDYTLGWRFSLEGRDKPDLSFGARATRRESDGMSPEHAVKVEVQATW